MSHDPDPVSRGDSSGSSPAGAPGGAGLSGRDLIGLGGLIVGAVVVFTVLGLVLDSVAGTRPVFTVVGVAVGMVAAGVGFWARVRSAMQG